jgi:hypothetical protein
MLEDPESGKYAFQRVKELFDDYLSSEREEVIE